MTTKQTQRFLQLECVLTAAKRLIETGEQAFGILVLPDADSVQQQQSFRDQLSSGWRDLKECVRILEANND